MSHQINSRVNFYDGQNITEEDMDTEQTAWHGSFADSINFISGSGVEKEYPTQRVLFDSNSVPSTIQTLISTQNFDGEPIYPTDSFGNTVFSQPSNSGQGNQLEVEISGSALDGTPTVRVYIFGTIFGEAFAHEVITFDSNSSRITRKYFTKIVAIMTQDFRGNQNTVVDGVQSRNNGGRLRILEALPMTVARDAIMVQQSQEPNQDYANFKPAILFKTLDIILDEIAASDSLNKDDLEINVTAKTTRKLFSNETGVIIGQKFKATTNNIQKITILLSVEKRTLVPESQQFDWSGDLVVGIRPLQLTTSCPTDIIPNTSIEFDPEPSPIAEVSFDKNELESLGTVLTDVPQKVDFVYTQSLLANPNIAPTLTVGAYYILTIRRSGNISTGNIVLQEAANTDSSSTETDEMRMSVFSQNKWTDIPESDLWFQVYTNAIRIVDGTCIDNGVITTSPKIKKNASTGIEEPYVEGRHSLIDVSENTENYVIVQSTNSFDTPVSHPSTGNPVFSRITDVASVSVVSESTLTTLISAGNNPVILGSVTDTNPTENPTITGYTVYPGLQRTNTFTIINPSSDVLVSNLNGSILTPNIDEPDQKYRIISKAVYTDAYGDINGDGIIDANDVTRCQELGDIVLGDGYSKDLESGAVPSADQLAGMLSEYFTMEEILRADVTDSGIVSTADSSAIQQYISLGTAFAAGSSFTRVVLTVENLTSPLTTSPDIIGNDSSFNDVPFTQIQYRIDFIPLWTESNITITDLRRFVPKTFVDVSATDITGSPKSGGENTFFVPNDIIITGSILDVDSNPYKIDLEVNSITIELPDGDTEGELDIFTNYIKNKMKFSDGTLVSSSALTNNQVKAVVSIQSHVKDLSLDGYDFVESNETIDETIAVLYTQSSGILRIRAKDIRYILTRPELRTRIIISVYLKKAGFQNTEVNISADDVTDLIIPL